MFVPRPCKETNIITKDIMQNFVFIQGLVEMIFEPEYFSEMFSYLCIPE